MQYLHAWSVLLDLCGCSASQRGTLWVEYVDSQFWTCMPRRGHFLGWVARALIPLFCWNGCCSMYDFNSWIVTGLIWIPRCSNGCWKAASLDWHFLKEFLATVFSYDQSVHEIYVMPSNILGTPMSCWLTIVYGEGSTYLVLCQNFTLTCIFVQIWRTPFPKAGWQSTLQHTIVRFLRTS